MKQKPKIYFHSQIGPDEIRAFEEKGLEAKPTAIHEAYFGRHPTPNPSTSIAPLGLNLFTEVNYWVYGATYARMEDIEGLMNELGAGRTEELKGKEVTAHLSRGKLVGISAPVYSVKHNELGKRELARVS
ncbi:hypothetical protein D4Q76_02910 [archaeon]|nr:MAG: hypothetical protein D4Q76_02910 [archaeon]